MLVMMFFNWRIYRTATKTTKAIRQGWTRVKGVSGDEEIGLGIKVLLYSFTGTFRNKIFISLFKGFTVVEVEQFLQGTKIEPMAQLVVPKHPIVQ